MPGSSWLLLFSLLASPLPQEVDADALRAGIPNLELLQARDPAAVAEIVQAYRNTLSSDPDPERALLLAQFRFNKVRARFLSQAPDDIVLAFVRTMISVGRELETHTASACPEAFVSFYPVMPSVDVYPMLPPAIAAELRKREADVLGYRGTKIHPRVASVAVYKAALNKIGSYWKGKILDPSSSCRVFWQMDTALLDQPDPAALFRFRFLTAATSEVPRLM